MSPIDNLDLQRKTKEAELAYVEALTPEMTRRAWHAAVDHSEADLRATLLATHNLTGIETALKQSGAHVRALRHLMAPPLSQDQFKLACADWTKGSEKSGRPIEASQAKIVAETISGWLDPHLISEIAAGSQTQALRGAVYLLANQRYQTERRSLLATAQESQACEILNHAGYTFRTSELIDRHGLIPPRHYLRNANFATSDHAEHEVDIAVGFKKDLVLAIECKVSNDATNSIKRINDVLKKHTAWKKKWGDFVVTGALLQGVFAAKDVARLQYAGVIILWSHRLDELRTTLEELENRG